MFEIGYPIGTSASGESQSVGMRGHSKHVMEPSVGRTHCEASMTTERCKSVGLHMASPQQMTSRMQFMVPPCTVSKVAAAHSSETGSKRAPMLCDPKSGAKT